MAGNPHELQSLRSISPVSQDTNARPHPFSTDAAQKQGIIGQGQKQPRLSLYCRFVENSWALEFLAWLFGALTLVILIIVLRVFNGKPLNRWNSSISVNTLVNVLTTIASTALIFPVTSATAQLRWLWLQKKARSVADFDSFDACGETTRDGSQSYSYPSIPRLVGTAIYTAIVGTTADPSDVRATCQTSDCTFGSYSTLGVCSRVNDVTPDVVQRCRPSRKDPTLGCAYIVKELQDHPPWRISNLTTGGGGNGKGPLMFPNTLWVGSSDIVRTQIRGATQSGYQYTFPDPNTLSEFYTVYVQDTTDYDISGAGPGLSSSVVALKAGLDLCVYQYDTTFINGVTKTVEKGRVTDLKWARVDKVIANKQFSAVSATSGGQEYWMDSSTVNAFNQYLGLEIFRGSSHQGINVQNSGLGARYSDAAETFAGLLVNKPRPDGRDALKKMLDNLGTGMTNALRTTADQAATFPGVAQSPENYIAVEFRWLIVPILSVILSLIFLSAVIYATAQSGVPVWKTSPIAALLSLDHDVGSAIASQDHTRSLDERANDLALQLKQGGDSSWVLEMNK
ncbi:MAG: hypothetical protein Q9164_006653 [Protoblastenia rupestris]